MAKDIEMKKGKDIITISKEFLDHYKNLGYEIIEKKISNKTEKMKKQNKEKEV